MKLRLEIKAGLAVNRTLIDELYLDVMKSCERSFFFHKGLECTALIDNQIQKGSIFDNLILTIKTDRNRDTRDLDYTVKIPKWKIYQI